ncbi:hypothetical protein N9K49_02070 [Flavobacteriaceae bacterium]|nr:hypothetical protein [Flavobacteriaceae bacterium]
MSCLKSHIESAPNLRLAYSKIEREPLKERGTRSYWRDVAAIKRWKDNLDHQKAQIEGKKTWYSQYKVRIAKVERDYDFLKK